MVEEVVEQKGVDPAQVAEIEDALNDVQADLDSTDDDDEALTLIRQRKILRERLAELHDAATAETVVRLVDTGQTFAEVWESADEREFRRGVLARAYSSIRVKMGRKGRHGLDPARIVPLSAEGGHDPDRG